MRTTVLIPSYRRPQMLAKCLDGVGRQTLLPNEVIVCLRESDHESRKLIQHTVGFELRVALSEEPGVIAAMNVGLEKSTGEVVALLDDDAIPFADWLERIVGHLRSDPQIAGVGGVDLQSNPDHQRRGSGHLQVGTFHWSGCLLGNHHLGSGHAQRVHVLKGCNCAYEGAFLRRVGFDRLLRGSGAQVGWEISLGFDAMEEHRPLLYDPAIRVNHLIAPRHDTDTVHRGLYNADAAYDITWNAFSILRRKAPWSMCVRSLMWELLVGSPITPGLLRFFDLRLGNRRARFAKISNTWRAFVDSRFCHRAAEAVAVGDRTPPRSTSAISKYL